MSQFCIYYDGVSAKKHLLNIYLGQNILEGYHNNTKVLAWDYKKIIIHKSATIKNDAIISLVHGDARLHLNYELYCKLKSKLPKGLQYSQSKAHKFRESSIVIFLISVIVFGGYYVPSLLSDKLVRFIPVSTEQNIGNKVFDTMVAEKSVLDNQEKQRILLKILNRLKNTDYYKKNYLLDVQLYISNSKEVNAFTFPGGKIVINQELINKAENPNELIGVVAHELGHVLERHGMQALISNIGLYATIGHLFGDYGIPTLIAETSYSRDMERKADDIAIIILQQAKVDPSGLISFLKKTKIDIIDERYIKYLSTHPISSERINRLKYSKYNSYYPVITEKEWLLLKNIRQ